MMSLDTLISLEYRDEFQLRINLIRNNNGRGKPYLAKRLRRNLAHITDIECDEHDACFSYPNCDLMPSGCLVVMGDDVEPIGHKG